MLTIAIDAMGGDHAPDITVLGSLEALRANPNLSLILVGQAERIEPLLASAGDVRNRLTIVDAREVIETAEPPVIAIRKKADSSLVCAYSLLREKKVKALVSAGSTGAVMAGGMFRLGRVPGIDRPALAVPLPTIGPNPVLLVDLGANVDCLPEWLLQFGRMGSTYMQRVMGIEKPRVALLSNGEEAEKGNQLTKVAHGLFKTSDLHFIGNLEARGVPLGEADVIVTDGFAGNVLLKSMEGVTKAVFTMLKRELMASTSAKLGGLLAKGAFARIKKSLDADEVGGTPLLGVTGAVVKAHGNSNAHAFSCAIRQAVRIVEGDVVGIIEREAAQEAEKVKIVAP